MPLPIEALTTAALSAALDAAARRQAVTAANVANANAQDYVPLRAVFDARLAEAREALAERGVLAASDLEAIRVDVEPAEQAPGVPARVQLDAEMADLARTAVDFQALTQALSRHLGLLALAAGDGRK
jgi:flagellar basal-body rod protein FlgB